MLEWSHDASNRMAAFKSNWNQLQISVHWSSGHQSRLQWAQKHLNWNQLQISVHRSSGDTSASSESLTVGSETSQLEKATVTKSPVVDESPYHQLTADSLDESLEWLATNMEWFFYIYIFFIYFFCFLFFGGVVFVFFSVCIFWGDCLIYFFFFFFVLWVFFFFCCLFFLLLFFFVFFLGGGGCVESETFHPLLYIRYCVKRRTYTLLVCYEQ